MTVLDDYEDIEFDEGNESELAGHDLTPWQVIDIIESSDFVMRNKKSGSADYAIIGYDRGNTPFWIFCTYQADRRLLRPVTGRRVNTAERKRYLS